MGCNGLNNNTCTLSHEPVAARKNKHRRSHAITDFSTECFRIPENNRHRRSSAMSQLDFENILDQVMATSNNDDEPVLFHRVVEHSPSVPTIISFDSVISEEEYMQFEDDSMQTEDCSETTVDALEMYLQELYRPNELRELRSLARQQLGLAIDM
jgi:hypothetical protein